MQVTQIFGKQQFVRPNKFGLNANQSNQFVSKLIRKGKVFATDSSEENVQIPAQQQSMSSSEELEEKKGSMPFTASEFFGSYLQLAVWITVLSIAFKAGLEQVKENPAAAGLFLAPPGGALVLIISFLVYRVVFLKEDEDN
eukprot:TRINITY_DN3034_c0_g1_i1.p3 TRINITY_DN3034_c0_g1~~TRINITY_DN3034_c0_g1_i1.p3  ORF type:complete len:141 (-),score=30.43 TRINITY_DN3034_c0_g1_i1:449-871(-)